MNIVIGSVAHGPWADQDGADTEGFRSAANILHVIERRLKSGEASADDRTRYRIAAGTIERGARKRGTVLAHVDGDDLLAWLDGEIVATIFAPPDIPRLRSRLVYVLEGSGPLRETIVAALDSAIADTAGIVLTVEPHLAVIKRATATSRPTRPVAVRTILPAPDIAAAIGALPRGADLVFAGDHRRLASADTLRRQLRTAISSGEPLSVGSQAKHEVLTEVFRELHHPDSPAGAVRLMYATEGEEGQPLRFGPLPHRSGHEGGSMHVGLMSMRHTELDSEVNGYWFRNRLVSVTGRSHAAAEAYCHRDSLRRLRLLAQKGITDLYITHTGLSQRRSGSTGLSLRWWGRSRSKSTPDTTFSAGSCTEPTGQDGSTTDATRLAGSV